MICNEGDLQVALQNADTGIPEHELELVREVVDSLRKRGKVRWDDRVDKHGQTFSVLKPTKKYFELM